MTNWQLVCDSPFPYLVYKVIALVIVLPPKFWEVELELGCKLSWDRTKTGRKPAPWKTEAESCCSALGWSVCGQSPGWLHSDQSPLVHFTGVSCPPRSVLPCRKNWNTCEEFVSMWMVHPGNNKPTTILRRCNSPNTSLLHMLLTKQWFSPHSTISWHRHSRGCHVCPWPVSLGSSESKASSSAARNNLCSHPVASSYLWGHACSLNRFVSSLDSIFKSVWKKKQHFPSGHTVYFDLLSLSSMVYSCCCCAASDC